MRDDFYRAFEERLYAPREVIKKLRMQYLPFVSPLAAGYPQAPTFDLGCGRGEWLELMTEIGFKPYGVDLDEGMLGDCIELNLPAEKGDAVAFIATLPSESQAIVSAFHVVEHISFNQLRTVVSEAFRVLKPGGLLILETPNPENIVVATRNFYLDPTHQRPIPPQLLSFLSEYYGFDRVKTVRLQESKELIEKRTLSLHDVLGGVSPDYAVIAQKAADHDIFHALDTAFDTEYGLSLAMLAAHYDEQLEAKAQQVEVKVQEAEARAGQAETKAHEAHAKAQEAHAKAQEAHAKAQEAEARAGQAEAALTAIYKSRSWRITAPLRWAGNVTRWFVRGSIAWLTFAPGSRPRRILRRALISIKCGIYDRPLLKAVVARLLSPFPQLEMRLRSMGNAISTGGPFITNSREEGTEGLEYLSPRARKIYFDLKTAVEQRQKEQH